MQEENVAEKVAQLKIVLNTVQILVYHSFFVQIDSEGTIKTSEACEKIAEYVNNNAEQDPLVSNWQHEQNEFKPKGCCF